MSESFINKPPANPDEDTVYTMGGLDALPAEGAGGLDLGQFIGSAAQLAQLYPGSQNRPQYEPGLTDIRFTRSFQGASPGGSFYSPSGAGNAPGPSSSEIIYQQPLIQPQDQAGTNEALLGGLLGMDWSGAYQDYLDKLQAQSQDVNISNVFTPTNTFTPTYNPVTDIEVNPNINVSQTQTQTQTQQQQQQQSQGGSDLDEFEDQDQDQDQTDTQDSFDINDLLSGSNLASLIAALTAAGYVVGSGTTGSGTTNTGTTGTGTGTGTTGTGTGVGTGTGTGTTNTGTGTGTTITDDMVEGGLDTDFFNDTLTGGNTIDTIISGNQNDILGSDTLISGNVNDTLITGNKNDVIINDTLISDNVNDTLISGNQNDVITIDGNANDTLVNGTDTVTGLEGLTTETDTGTTTTTDTGAGTGTGTGTGTGIETGTGTVTTGTGTGTETTTTTGTTGSGTGTGLTGLPTGEEQAFQPKGPTGDLGNGVGARSKEEFDRFGDVLNLEDLGNPDLSLTDQLYLAGLAYSQEPNAATRENYYNWYKAMTPEDQATPEQLAELNELKNQVTADRVRVYTAPVEDAATSKFQSDIANAVSQRDNLLNQYNAAIAQGASSQVISELQAGFDRLDQALSNYNVSEILSNPDFAREQALQAGSKAIEAFTDPNNLPSPEAVDSVLSNVIDTVGADIIAENISEEGAQAILEAAGSDIAGEIAGDIAGPVAAALMSLAQGGSAGTAVSEAAKAYAVAQIAAIPGVGPFIAAAIALDSVLSGVLGYESPINEAVAGAAENIDKAFSFIGRSIGSDPIGGVSDFVTDNIFGGTSDIIGGQKFFDLIKRGFGFQEGGLVDLPGDSMYNDDSEGVLPDLMGFARGGVIPLPGGGKIAKGPGGGLDDLIPTSIDGRRAAALSDGEFVIPADVVSMMGDGSSNAGSKRLYDLVRQVRQAKTGTSRQAGPLQVGKILERTMR